MAGGIAGTGLADALALAPGSLLRCLHVFGVGTGMAALACAVLAVFAMRIFCGSWSQVQISPLSRITLRTHAVPHVTTEREHLQRYP